MAMIPTSVSHKLDPTVYTTRDLYLQNPKIKRAGTQTTWTPALIAEYKKCMNDMEYFARTYVKIITLDEGKRNIDPYPYQLDLWQKFSDNRFNIVLAARQSGKSIAYIVWLLHYIIFNRDKNVALLANKAASSVKLLGRISLALEQLPFFLQPGCKAYNKGSIEFDTDTIIYAGATSKSGIRSDSVNVVVLDEYAFVEDDVEFMTSTYPVISAGKTTKIIIVSTPNGVGNSFHSIWDGAIQKKNNYVATRVDWWDVPGRDAAWKKETIENTTEEQFRQEFGNEFLGSSDTLISPSALSTLVWQKPIYKDDAGIRAFKKPVEGHQYVMTVDVCRGRGKDYSAFSIIDITEAPYEQVVSFQDNFISPLLFPTIIYKWAKLYNEAFLVVESNDQGAVVSNIMYYDMEYENMFVESYVKSSGVGLETTKRVKSIGCSNMKDLIEQKKLLIHDERTVSELRQFIVKGAKYEAKAPAHDDLVATLWLFGYLVGENIFEEFVGEGKLAKHLFDEKMKIIEDEIPPLGIMGSDEYDDIYARAEEGGYSVAAKW